MERPGPDRREAPSVSGSGLQTLPVDDVRHNNEDWNDYECRIHARASLMLMPTRPQRLLNALVVGSMPPSRSQYRRRLHCF
jgi:hypothetical protein